MNTEARRVESLRTLLREYLVALDTGNEFVAEMLARCTLDPRTGAVVLLIPLGQLPNQHTGVARVPAQPTASEQSASRDTFVR